MRIPLKVTTDGLAVVIETIESSPRQTRFDFLKAGCSRNVGKGLLAAYVALYGSNKIESQRATLLHIKHFITATRSSGKCPDVLSENALERFDSWAERQGWKEKFLNAIHNTVRRMLDWCLRNAPHMIDPRARVYAATYTYTKREPRSAPSEELVKQVLGACYLDIEETEQRLNSLRERIVMAEEDPIADLLMELLCIGDGFIPLKAAVLRQPRGSTLIKRASKLGGFQRVLALYHLGARDVFPYYLAVLVQTSANPQALLTATRDCIVPHPVRADMEWVKWDKDRAHAQQRADFHRGKKWAATNIVRRLLVMNADLVSLCAPERRNDLFICRNQRGGVARPSWQAIHNCFDEFLKRHRLPQFQLRDMRAAGAQLEERAARSIHSAQRRLNHSRVSTSELYVDGQHRREDHAVLIHHYQGELIKEARQSVEGRRAEKSALAAPEVASQTVFGFLCKDPFGGVGPSAKKGTRCLQFQGCATCPGAIVPVDDPSVVARIVGARDHLIQTQRRALIEGWSTRFGEVYGSILSIIEKEVLVAVSHAVIERARGEAKPILPRLE